MISIVYGSVRVAEAGTWPEARGRLREQINAMYDYWPQTEGAQKARESELARVTLPPLAEVMTISRYLYAAEGGGGLTAGDLAYVHDFPNGSLGYGWTINVKCKILSIGPVHATVRITGDSIQFMRGETRSVPLSCLRRR